MGAYMEKPSVCTVFFMCKPRGVCAYTEMGAYSGHYGIIVLLRCSSAVSVHTHAGTRQEVHQTVQ